MVKSTYGNVAQAAAQCTPEVSRLGPLQLDRAHPLPRPAFGWILEKARLLLRVRIAHFVHGAVARRASRIT